MKYQIRSKGDFVVIQQNENIITLTKSDLPSLICELFKLTDEHNEVSNTLEKVRLGCGNN